MNSETYRCWAEIDQSALRHNAAVVRERLGPEVQLLAVVKANGYGHGMVGVAKALAQDAHFFGVANLEEATLLRGEVSQPIIVLGPALPDERRRIAEGGFIPSISTIEEAQDLDRAVKGAPIDITLVIDTGMGRMGVPQAEARALFQKVVALPNIRIHSLSTHLPVSNEDAEFTRAELVQFAALLKGLRAEFPGDYKVHVLPSAGVLAFADPPFDIVRAGMMLYGISPFPEFQKLLRPVLDVENPDRSDPRHAGGAWNQLRPDFHHTAPDARGHAFRRLRRRLSPPSFESRGSGPGSRPALRAFGTGHDGFDDDRCFPNRRRRGGR